MYFCSVFVKRWFCKILDNFHALCSSPVLKYLQVDIRKTKDYFATENCDMWGAHTRYKDDICLFGCDTI
jgi:hypothetical protein